MKSKWQLISSVFQLAVGIAAVVAFVVLAVNGENMARWIVTLILAVAFIVLGVIGLVSYVKQK